MKLNDFLGVFTTLSFALPALLIFAFGLFVNKSLLALAFNCCITGFYNALNADIWIVNKKVLMNSAVFSSYMDAPLMMALLALYCHTPLKKKTLLAVAVLYITYEIVIAMFFGLQPISSVYTSGVGLLLVFALGVYFFVGQLKHTIRFNKGKGRTFIAAAIFFGYGLHNITYLLNCIFEAPEINDIFLLYYAGSIIFCTLVTVGLVHLYLRHRQLKQLLRVRRELREFFEGQA